MYNYAGKNRVPELQKFFQVREDREGCEINRLKKTHKTSFLKLGFGLVYHPTSFFSPPLSPFPSFLPFFLFFFFFWWDWGLNLGLHLFWLLLEMGVSGTTCLGWH
jgi:hypothetical protein